MASLNWARAQSNQRMRDRGTESMNGAFTSGRNGNKTARASSARRASKPPAGEEASQRTIAEIDKFWRDRSGRAIVIRLTEYNGFPLIDLRTFYTAADGTLRPGKGMACGVRLLPQLAKSIAKAMSEAQRLGLLPAGEGEA